MAIDKSIDPDEMDEKPREGGGKKFNQFDCPSCSAYNPYDDGFVDRDEVRCGYCGAEFRVRINEEGHVKLKEI